MIQFVLKTPYQAKQGGTVYKFTIWLNVRTLKFVNRVSVPKSSYSVSQLNLPLDLAKFEIFQLYKSKAQWFPWRTFRYGDRSVLVGRNYNYVDLCIKVVVSKEPVVMRRWGICTQKFGFIKR